LDLEAGERAIQELASIFDKHLNSLNELGFFEILNLFKKAQKKVSADINQDSFYKD
jgi:hypothetical protein